MSGQTRRLLLVGLGNPLREHSRHNCGKYVVDHIADILKFRWSTHKKINGEVANGSIILTPVEDIPKPGSKSKLAESSEPVKSDQAKVENRVETWLLKSNEFMNLNGLSVRSALKTLNIKASDMFVFHDDMDVDLGKFKLKTRGSPK
ncbi:Peptidyl-tRNA hydrolase [Smittium culicis]|uniref:Peptidyl-tRNA hydrolase n=1 Tax=Smittium culicis TaxID=133412 RepID=A0A1R1X468_9FUNG|nr:Peptidyl-tRNA hydrolase [Smittium culicis]